MPRSRRHAINTYVAHRLQVLADNPGDFIRVGRAELLDLAEVLSAEGETGLVRAMDTIKQRKLAQKENSPGIMKKTGPPHDEIRALSNRNVLLGPRDAK